MSRTNSGNNGSGNIRKDGGSYRNNGKENRSLPNSAVHKPVPGKGGRGGKSK